MTRTGTSPSKGTEPKRHYYSRSKNGSFPVLGSGAMTCLAPRPRHRVARVALVDWVLSLALSSLLGCAPGAHDGAHDGSSGTGGSTETGGASGTGGTASVPSEQDFMLGADLSSVPEQIDGGAVYLDTDGSPRPILELLGAHGFNYVRLRTFVDPAAPFGYAYGDGGAACVKAEAYCDLSHTVEFAKRIKQANMGFLLDFHYSDNWADPGKQIIPESWRHAETIDELAALLKSYTRNAIATLVDAGARPDVVQIGNEITPGLLIHVPTNNTDCWGNHSARNALNGSTSNWEHLAALLRAGIDGVKEVDPSIRTLVHLENTDDPTGAADWIRTAQQLGVEFDILGMSCYPAYQGPPSVWVNTFTRLAESFPDLSFVVAEFGPEARAVVDVVSNIPGDRGLGAFHWEPTLSGAWGPSLFTLTPDGYRANDEDFALYDELRDQVGL